MEFWLSCVNFWFVSRHFFCSKGRWRQFTSVFTTNLRPIFPITLDSQLSRIATPLLVGPIASPVGIFPS